MDYKVDFEDVLFTLFDFLKAGELTKMPRFQDQGEDMYRSILEEALKLAKKEIAPLNESGDRTGLKVIDGNVKMPEGWRQALRAYGDNGLFAMDLDPEYNGMGLPTTIATAAFEFFMGANASFALFQMLTRGAANVIQTYGSDEQKKTYLPNMNTGVWTGTMCLTEPHAGSAVGDITTIATPESDGSYKIEGTKIFITCGNHDISDNIIHLVLARVKGDPAGTKGISLFIVPAKRLKSDGTPGDDNDVKLISTEHKMGIKASPTCLLRFGDKNECKGWLIGKQTEGMKYMFKLMNEARLECGQQGVAIGGTAYEHALQYAKDRTQGGKTLIIQFPDVRRMLMTMKAYVESLRALILETAIFVDTAFRHPDAAVREEYDAYVGLLTPICKAFTSDMGFRITELAVQTYGGYGFCQDYPAEQYMRDVKIASLYEGTNGIQAMDFIGRKFLSNGGQNLKRYLSVVTKNLASAGEAPELKALAQKTQAALERVESVAQIILERAQKNPQAPGLLATPFLRAVSDVLCAQILVRKAKVAADQLAKNPPADRARFLKGKIEAAKFYVEQILPEADLNLARIRTEDVSALADVF